MLTKLKKKIEQR